MRALVKASEGAGQMELRTVAEPQPSATEVIVAVEACGVCGTDLKIESGHFPCDPPVIVGHEFAGTIVARGAAVRGWDVGEAVVAEQHFRACGCCEYCLTGRRQFCLAKRSPGYRVDGAFAERIAVESSLLHRIPVGLSFRAAALCEPMAVAAYGVFGRAAMRPGDSVAILGCGPIAMLALQLVRAAGAAAVIMTGIGADEAVRFPIARELGADLVLNAERDDPVAMTADFTRGRGVDLVIDLSGSSRAIRQGFELLRRDGTFCALGLPAGEVSLPWTAVALRAPRLIFSFSSDFNSWEQCLTMLACGKIQLQHFTTHAYSLEQWPEAFAAAREGRVLKAIIEPCREVR